MPSTEGSGTAFSTDPHLNDSINDVLSEFVDDAATGASDPTQDGSSVESPRETPAPSPGDHGHESGTPPTHPTDRAPSAPADGLAPDPAAPEPPTEPFSYSANGEAKAINEFVRIPGEGVFVPEAHVPRLQQLASRAESNEAALRAAHQQVQEAQRLTTWQTRRQEGVNSDGSPRYVNQTLTGAAAVEASRVVTATAAAKAMTLERALDAMTDPATFQRFYHIVEQNGEYSVVVNPQAIQDVKREAALAAREWALTARAHVSTLSAPPPPAETPVSAYAMPTIEQIAKDYNIAGLSAADKTFLSSHFDRYVITTKDGRAVDPRFIDAMKERATWNAQQAKLTSSSSVVNKFNRGQDKGRVPVRAPAPVAPPTPAPQDSRKRRSRNERAGPSFDELFAHGMADPDVQAALQGHG